MTLKNIPIGLYLWMLCYAIGGWLFGDTAARLAIPHLGSISTEAIEPSMIVGGFAGTGIFLLLGAVLAFIYRKTLANLGGKLIGMLLPISIGGFGGAIIGATFILALVVFDYKELLVAFLDYQGAPVFFGGILGGIVGAVWGAVQASTGVNRLGRVLIVSLASVMGVLIGFLTWLIHVFTLMQFYMS